MTNREKYLDEILAKDCTCEIAKIINKEHEEVCPEKDCRVCEEEALSWLKAEYKEPECTHDECIYCKKIEDLDNMRYCSKRCRTINGTETIKGCNDFRGM